MMVVGILIGLTLAHFAIFVLVNLQLNSQFNEVAENENPPGLAEIIPQGADKSEGLKHSDKRKGTNHAALCCVVKDEEAYIDEWVDYHHALGFDSIHVYDNSDSFELKQWGEEKGQHVTVTHWPGIAKQGSSYLDCARRLAAEGGNHTWAAFFDVDEFLILKKHAHVEDFLLEKCATGTLTVNWLMFSGMSRTLYSPAPVTKRFIHREEKTNKHIKSIVRLRDMNFEEEIRCHYPTLVNASDQKDTNGKRFEGPWNPDGPTDVAVLHHYERKSYKEYVTKKMRGRASMPQTEAHYLRWKRAILGDVSSSSPFFHPEIYVGGGLSSSTFFDDAAWKAMKKYVPEYAAFDAL
jgi:hypothetical protein